MRRPWRPMKGTVYVAAEGIQTERTLASWVERGLTFVRTLPKKAAKKTARAVPQKRIKSSQ